MKRGEPVLPLRRLGLAAFVLGALVAIGCSGDSPSGASCDAQNPCKSGAICVSGTCQTPPDLEEACGSACPSGQSCQLGEDFPGGACTMTCASPSDCPAASTCVGMASGSFCLKDCGSAGDCPQGFTCESFTGASSPVCVSPQANAPPAASCSQTPNLVAGGTVGPSTEPTSCQRPVVSSTLPGGQVQHLGQFAVGTQHSFNVPPGTVSVSIVSQAVSAVSQIVVNGNAINNSVVPGLVILPDGTTLYSDWVSPPDNVSLSPLVYQGLTPNTGVLTYPNTTPGLDVVSSTGAPGGSWSMTVNDFAFECLATTGCNGGSDGGVYDITVLTKPGPLATQGTLDVAIYLVTESGLTSASAPNNASVKRFVQALAKMYGDAGICLGNVTFYDVPSWAQAKYASSINVDQDGPCQDLHQMFTLSQPGNTLNFFFVDALHTSNNVGGTLVGLDGAIPGASTLGGTPASGAAVTMADLSAGNCTSPSVDPSHCGADEVAFITAHEGGHWLGLYHTSESHGTHFDPLVDTPSCVCDLCAKAGEVNNCADKNSNPDGGPTFVDGDRCLQSTVACGGGENLMFWELNPSSVGTLTHEQAEVMLANPLVH